MDITLFHYAWAWWIKHGIYLGLSPLLSKPGVLVYDKNCKIMHNGPGNTGPSRCSTRHKPIRGFCPSLSHAWLCPCSYTLCPVLQEITSAFSSDMYQSHLEYSYGWFLVFPTRMQAPWGRDNASFAIMQKESNCLLAAIWCTRECLTPIMVPKCLKYQQ